ncbi:MAG: FG-GAP-like repeat-containing protein [Bacteroidota bacterium]
MKVKSAPSTRTSKRYRRLKSKYQAFKKRLDRLYKDGSFFRFSLQKQKVLLRRLQRYLQALQRLAAPAALFSASLLCSPTLEAHTFTEVTDTNSPFIFLNLATDAPFGLNGTEVARSQTNVTLVDIDGDGDFDAFIGSTNYISYFKNTSTNPNIPAFELSIERDPFGLSSGYYSTPVFVDIDNDGDLDAFVGSDTFNGSPTGIAYFENTTTDSSVPAFLRSTSTEPFGVFGFGDDSIPDFIDIDEDGDFDVFVGSEEGTTRFFRNTGTPNNPAFSLSTSLEPFGISDVGSNSAPSFVDIDNDGDLDVFVKGDFFYTGRNINYFENTSTNGSIAAFTLVSSENPFGMEYIIPNGKPSFADLDNDNDLDLFIGKPSGGLVKFFENQGNKNVPIFQTPYMDFVIPGGVDNPRQMLVDIDLDGDFDLFILQERKRMNFLENIGNNNNPIFSLSSESEPFGINVERNDISASFVDIDSDGDFDLFIGGTEGTKFFENISLSSSIPNFVLSSESTPFGLGGGTPRYSFADLDNDGDVDALAGVETSGYSEYIYYENISNDITSPIFEASSDSTPFDLNPENTLTPLIPFLVDIDGDNDLDLFEGRGFGATTYYENIGNASSPAYIMDSNSEPFGIFDVGRDAKTIIVDLDNDGFYEAIIGEKAGNLNYFESNISTSLPKLEITNFNTLNNTFCLDVTKTFTEVHLGNRGCDRNGNAIYTASVTPASQGVSATVVGAGEIEGDCNFFIELSTSETAIAGNYSINLTIEDTDGVSNSSSTPEITNTGTVIVFNLGIVEVLNLEEVEVEPILGATIDNGTSEDFMVNINNTTATTTYEWLVAGTPLPTLIGDDVDTGAAIPIDLGDGNIINVSASTESVVGDFTQSILTIDNPTGGAAQDFEVRLTATQECGPDTQSAIFTSGDFDCSDADLILGNRILPTDNYEAFNRITSQSTIAPNSGVAFRAGTIIELKPNFHAQSGATFTAEIEDCTTETNEVIEERQSIVTPSISSLQIAPNPTNGASQLQFQLAKAHPVVVEIYDARGTLTTTVLNGQLEKGIHQIALPTTDFSNGMYFVIVRTQDGNMVEKLMVLGE